MKFRQTLVFKALSNGIDNPLTVPPLLSYSYVDSSARTWRCYRIKQLHRVESFVRSF